METNIAHASPLPKSGLAENRLESFFITHLTRIYCAKAHIVKRLPEIGGQANFTDLRFAITETIENIDKQLLRIKEIFALMYAPIPVDGSIDLMSGLIEDAFSTIHLYADDPELRDLSILFYMQNVESMEMTSFHILQLTASKLKRKDITQMLKENFDEAKDDRALLSLINAKYLLGK